MKKKINIQIDGKKLKANIGDTILEAAISNGIDIPNLCYNKKVSHTAACRLCMVKMEGQPNVFPSCTTPAREGQIIIAFDKELQEMRRTVLDLALSHHDDDCISCTKDGNCQLQDLAFRYGLGKDERTFPPIWQEITESSDYTSPVINYDASKCIQCGRCVKACFEIQGKGIIGFTQRGIKTTMGTGYPKWDMSKCDGCGECIQMCPVGAITEKPIYTKSRIRNKDIEKTTITTCPYCGVGCQIEVSTKVDHYTGGNNRIIKIEGASLVPNEEKLCVKGRFGLDFINRPERLKKPLIKKKGKFVEVEWDEAIRFAARGLSDIKDKHGPDAIAGLASARVTNEENYVFQKFIRSVIGTNNIDHCARLCHASTVAGLATTLGSGAMTNSIEELERAEVILVTGSNTTETHPVISTLIKRAVLFNKAKLIIVDPRKIDLVRYSTLWLRQNNGTDVAWLNGIINAIIENGWEDKDFIKERTENFEEMKKIVKKYTPKYTEKISGIPAEKIVEAAKLFSNTKKGSIVYAMGITQHSNGTNNVKSCANLAMITGNIGKKSTGVNPLRGQNNVQGACDMGALPNVYPGYQKVDMPEAQEKFENAWKKKLSNKVGLSIVEIMNAAAKGKIKAMYIMGENPMISDPNINHVAEALKKLDFLVCQDIFPTETTQYANVVFPALSFAEKFGNYTNTERRVLPLNKFMEPIGEAREDWAIIQSIAQGMGNFWNFTSTDDILREINKLTPQYGGITPERINAGERLQWPCPNPEHPGTKFLHKDTFVRGKGLFSAVDHEDPKEMPDKKYPFVLSTGRILFHYHTGTMTRKTKVLPQYVEEAYIEMSPIDAKKLQVANGEKVKISSRRGEVKVKVRETDKVKVGSVFMPFHFVEAAANVLTIDAIDPIAKIPELKVCAINIEKI